MLKSSGERDGTAGDVMKGMLPDRGAGIAWWGVEWVLQLVPDKYISRDFGTLSFCNIERMWNLLKLVASLVSWIK